MKAILVIDMPNKCNECPLFYDYLSCQANAEANIYGEKRPYNCPLRPLPSKGTMKNVVECEYNRGFVDGRNYCIDLVTGETE